MYHEDSPGLLTPRDLYVVKTKKINLAFGDRMAIGPPMSMYGNIGDSDGLCFYIHAEISHL